MRYREHSLSEKKEFTYSAETVDATLREIEEHLAMHGIEVSKVHVETDRIMGEHFYINLQNGMRIYGMISNKRWRFGASDRYVTPIVTNWHFDLDVIVTYIKNKQKFKRPFHQK